MTHGKLESDGFWLKKEWLCYSSRNKFDGWTLVGALYGIFMLFQRPKALDFYHISILRNALINCIILRIADFIKSIKDKDCRWLSEKNWIYFDIVPLSKYLLSNKITSFDLQKPFYVRKCIYVCETFLCLLEHEIWVKSVPFESIQIDWKLISINRHVISTLWMHYPLRYQYRLMKPDL